MSPEHPASHMVRWLRAESRGYAWAAVVALAFSATFAWAGAGFVALSPLTVSAVCILNAWMRHDDARRIAASMEVDNDD